jgi:hypothetical protein
MDAFVKSENCALLGNYAASRGNNPKESSSHLLGVGNLKTVTSGSISDQNQMFWNNDYVTSTSQSGGYASRCYL